MNEYRTCEWCKNQFGLTPKNQWAKLCISCYFKRKEMKENGQYDNKDIPGDRYNQRIKGTNEVY